MDDFVRDPNRSSSEFGQWIHEKLPRVMFAIDLDMVIYKKSTRILRIIEEKRPHQCLKDSQQCILPLLAKAVDSLKREGMVHRQSGVFVVFTEPPFNSGRIEQIGGEYEMTLDGERWRHFCIGEVL